jgi:hypothetical protein
LTCLAEITNRAHHQESTSANEEQRRTMKEKEFDATQTWENVKITHVNPVRRTVDVTIDGKVGPRRVRVRQGIDMGSSSAPQIQPGDTGNMMRVRSGRYFLTEHFPKDANKPSGKR